MDKLQSLADGSYEAPKLIEIGQMGSTLEGTRMGNTPDGGRAMIGTGNIGLSTLP